MWNSYSCLRYGQLWDGSTLLLHLDLGVKEVPGKLDGLQLTIDWHVDLNDQQAASVDAVGDNEVIHRRVAVTVLSCNLHGVIRYQEGIHGGNISALLLFCSDKTGQPFSYRLTILIDKAK